MSDLLAAAAAKLGAPEALVRRSAEARAKAAGSTVDDVLAAWAGGEAAPAAAAPIPAEPVAATSEASPEPAPAPPSTPAPAAAPSSETPVERPVVVTAGRPSEPPVLVGRHESLLGTAVAALALLGLSLLVGVVAASTPEETRGAYTSEVAYSATALAGQQIYLSQGCAACHTQMVRPLVADAGLGSVSVVDSNQVVGYRRVGPDLAHIGSRVAADSDLVALLEGGDRHPAYSGLDDTDLASLVAYLMEST